MVFSHWLIFTHLHLAQRPAQEDTKKVMKCENLLCFWFASKKRHVVLQSFLVPGAVYMFMHGFRSLRLWTVPLSDACLTQSAAFFPIFPSRACLAFGPRQRSRPWEWFWHKRRTWAGRTSFQDTEVINPRVAKCCAQCSGVVRCPAWGKEKHIYMYLRPDMDRKSCETPVMIEKIGDNTSQQFLGPSTAWISIWPKSEAEQCSSRWWR